jgi:hypothetical protein
VEVPGLSGPQTVSGPCLLRLAKNERDRYLTPSPGGVAGQTEVVGEEARIMPTDAPVNLLWTAGYDSTFRLLNLLGAGERPVRPIYVLDLDRRSCLQELRRLVLLRAMIDDWAPSAHFLPLEVSTGTETAYSTPIYTRGAAARRLSRRAGHPGGVRCDRRGRTYRQPVRLVGADLPRPRPQ